MEITESKIKSELREIGLEYNACKEKLDAEVATLAEIDDSSYIKKYLGMLKEFEMEVSEKMFSKYVELIPESDDNVDLTSKVEIELDPSDVTGVFLGFIKDIKANGLINGKELPEGFWTQFNELLFQVLQIKLFANKVAMCYTLAINGVIDEEVYKKLIVGGTLTEECVKAIQGDVVDNPSYYIKKDDLEFAINTGIARMVDVCEGILELPVGNNSFIEQYVDSLMGLYNEGVDQPEVFINYIANSLVKAIHIPEYSLISLFSSQVKILTGEA